MKYLRHLLLSAVSLFFLGCSSHFFQPDTLTYRTPEYYQLHYDDITFNSQDGTALHAWHLYPKGESKGLIFVAHGNAQNLSAYFVSWVWLIEKGYELFIFDYRAYGKSDGESDIPGSIEDTQAALDYLESIYTKKYFACGQSLGGTMLLNALAKRDNTQIEAAIIDSTFTGFSAIANEKMSNIWLAWPFQWIPYLTLSGKYDAIDKVTEINVPLLFLHGSKDHVIPANDSWQLFDASLRPKEFWLVKESGHIQGLEHPNVQNDFLEFLQRGRKFYHKNYTSMKIYE